MVAFVSFATAIDLMTNVALVRPSVMKSGVVTVAELELLAREILMPPAGAAALSLRIAVEEVPPLTDAGTIASEVRLGGVIVTTAFCDRPFKVAVMVTDC